MKAFFVSILLAACFLIAGAQTKADKITELVQAYAAQNSYNGTILVTEKGNILLHKGYGYKDAAAGKLNDENTIYQLGSVTKQFTAAVILKLAAQKKLKLTDKLSMYYPGYPKGDSITIHHLLSHTSGIVNYTNNEAFMSKEVLQPATEERMLSLFKNEPLEFSPGTKWGYSNSGYMLLGYIIKKVTKQPYEKVVRQMLLSPLKMTNSGFDYVGLKNSNKAKGYFVVDGAKSTESTYVDSSVSYAAGAMYSTTADMLKWHNGLMQNKILSRQWLEKAFTPVKNKYGYGWAIDSADGKRITTHNGGIFGFNSSFYRIEADDICIVMLNNTGNPKLDEIAVSVLNILYNKPYKLPEAKKEITLSQETLKMYEGLYEVIPQFQIVITIAEGKLMAQATNQPTFELFAQKENYFFLKAVEAEIEFVKNEKGEIEKLTLYQGGRKTDAKKVK
jgi:CubicO group peptidase (beta-lactamase class C family)